jgi:hypothetical protein
LEQKKNCPLKAKTTADGRDSRGTVAGGNAEREFVDARTGRPPPLALH